MNFRPKILVCEPNPQTMVTLTTILTHNNYSMEKAYDGHEVLDKIKTLHYDLALVSADMPGIDGFQVCRLLKESEQTRHIPAMIIAAMSDHVTRNRAIESGAEEFITTPINRVELLARVVTLLRIKNLHDTLQRQIQEKEDERKKLSQKTNELRILSEIARVVISVKDRQSAMNEIVNHIRDAFAVEGVLLAIRHETAWTIESLSDNLSQLHSGQIIDETVSIFDYVLQNEKPVIVNHVLNDGRFSPLLSRFTGLLIRTALCSPIFVRGSLIGVLIIFNKKDLSLFETADLTLLMTLSGQIALAIENMQLFDRLSSFNKNLQEQISASTQALLDLKNFNESIIQNISSGLITVDFSGKIVFANRAGAGILGYNEIELLDKHLADIIGSKAAQTILQPHEGDTSVGAEILIQTKQAKDIYIGYTTSFRYDSEKKMVGYILSFRDITQIKEMRSTILKMDRLVSLGMLTSGIAHEIRNPLAGIKTMAQALEKELGSDDARSEYVSRIIKQINRLNELLKAFFTYAKPVRPEKKYCDLAAIVKEVRELTRQRCENEKINVEEFYDPYLSKLFVDENQVEQVLINLIINAIDAMKHGGVLTIEAQNAKRALPPRFTEPREMIEIKISDTGMGISKDNLKSIFDPFFTTKQNGVGLGLSIVYRIIHEHGGEVLVDSVEKKGTTFTILLPLHDQLHNVDIDRRVSVA